jgi:hypothetical protein
MSSCDSDGQNSLRNTTTRFNVHEMKETVFRVSDTFAVNEGKFVIFRAMK